ncbi:MAG: hypothetical protein KAI66_03540 [Lentisphaeria bacterium]|nr:hypothetical protein [Lentisphaeria bacterium]
MRRTFHLIALPLLLLFAAQGRADNTTVFVTPETAIFECPAEDSAVLGCTGADAVLPSLETRRVLFRHNPAAPPGHHHPLTVHCTFHRIQIAPDKQAWVCEELLLDTKTGRIQPRPIPGDTQMRWLIAAVALFVALSVIAFRNGLHTALRDQSDLLSTSNRALLVGVLLSLHLALLAHTLFRSGCLVATPTDEYEYFRIARDILTGARSFDWSFNISVASLYIPLIAITGATEYGDISSAMLVINGLLLAPATLLMAFLAIEHLCRSTRKAAVAALLLILLPYLYCPVELHALLPDAPSRFKAVWALPLFSAASHHLYYLFVWTGWNGLGDTPSTFLVLLTILLALKLPAKNWHIPLVSAVFGLACFMRINNIFFAPLVAFLFWQRFREDLRSPQTALLRGGIALAAFLLCFCPQLIANALQFGSPLTFPYTYHTNQAAQGFNWSALSSGTSFLIGTNYLYMVAGVIGLAFLSNKSLRHTLTLWVVPLVLFFCGYTVVGASPMRFTLSVYPALLAAFVCLDLWWVPAENRRSRLLALAAILLSVLAVSPCHRLAPPFSFLLDTVPWGRTLNLALSWAAPLASAAIVLVTLRKERRLLTASLAFLVLFHSGLPHLILFCLAALLAWTISEWCREIITSMTRQTRILNL